MASTYEYITVADLENEMAIDFESRDSDLTDTVIEQKISTAERMVNSIAGESFSTSPPDNITAATTIIAKRLCTVLWNQKHPNQKREPIDKEELDATVKSLIEGKSRLIYDSIDTS